MRGLVRVCGALLFVVLTGGAAGQVTDDTGAVGAFTPNRTATGSLGALDAAVTIAVSGRQSVGGLIDINTLTGTILPEVSVEGTWVATSFFTWGTAVPPTRAGTVTADALFQIDMPPGTTQARVRVSAFSGGSATATLVATEAPGSMIVALAGTGTFTVGDGAGSLNVIVDSGTVTANAGTGNFNVVGTKSNNGGAPGSTNLGTLPAVANAAAPTHTEGNQVAHRTQLDGDLVTVMEDELPAGTQNIGDVDVASMPSVTIGTFPDNEPFNVAQWNGVAPTAAAAAADNFSNPTFPPIGAFNMVFDGTNWDRWPGDSTNGAEVQVTVFPDNEPFNQAQRGGVGVVAGACERETLLYVQIDQTSGEQLITGTASERVYICSFQVMTATAQNVALVDGTGSVCATSPTGLLGGSTAATGWNFAANGGIVLPPSRDSWTKTSTDADNVCLLQSGAGQVSGSLTYISIPNI